MQIEYLKTSSLKPYEKNAKKHDKKQVSNVAESIKQFGFVQPVVVDRDNNIIIGHCRLEDAKKLNLDEVPEVDEEAEPITKLGDIWQFGKHRLMCGSFLPCVEYMLYFSKRGRIWNNSLKPTSVYSKVYTSPKEVATKEAGGKVHPIVKPQQLLQDKLRISSNEDGIGLDVFGGSGSTLIACERLNRTCFMIEIDPHYCDVIIKRWENFTGKKAVLDMKV